MAVVEANKKRLLKVKEVADRLNVGESTVYHWGHRGVLSVVKLNGATRYREEDVDKMIADGLHPAKDKAA